MQKTWWAKILEIEKKFFRCFDEVMRVLTTIHVGLNYFRYLEQKLLEIRKSKYIFWIYMSENNSM